MKNIEDFLYKYISYDSNNEEYIVDSFTDFVYLDKNAVDRDIDEIRYFLANNIVLSDKYPSIYYLLVGTDNKLWNELLSLNDLRNLNNIYALAIKVGFINDDIRLRWENYLGSQKKLQGKITKDFDLFWDNHGNAEDFYEYFQPYLFDLSTDYIREDFLFQIRMTILPQYRIDINTDLVKRYIDKNIENSKYAETARYWWNKNFDATPDETARFERLLKTNLSSVLIYITYLYKNSGNFNDLLSCIKNGEDFKTMKNIEEYYAVLSDSEKKSFNDSIGRVFRNLTVEMMMTKKLNKIKKP